MAYLIGKLARLALPVLAFGLLPTANVQAATTWEAYVASSVDTIPAVVGMKRTIEAVSKATNGEVIIHLHLGGSLPISTTNITQAVSDDVVQLGDDPFFGGSVPIGELLRLPFLIQTKAELDKASIILEPYANAAFAKHGVVPLGVTFYPKQTLWSRKPLRSLADLKGLKMRVISADQAAFVTRFGGSAVTMAVTDVPSALDRGVVDGVFTASSGFGYPWRDLVKYNYRLGVGYANAYVIVNKDALEKLSPDNQAKVKEVFRENMPLTTQDIFAQEDVLTTEIATGGVVVTPERPEDVALGEKTMEGYWSEWAKARGPEAVEALAKVRAALGR